MGGACKRDLWNQSDKTPAGTRLRVNRLRFRYDQKETTKREGIYSWDMI